jgi:uncharacterized protein
MAMSMESATAQLNAKIAAAEAGDIDAYYDLGIVFSMGHYGVPVDLIAAHKWFNLSAIAGNRNARDDRAEVAADMSPAEIAEAQRQARAWLAEVPLVRAAVSGAMQLAA